MNKAVFLDRDGTLNEDLGYTYKTGHFKLLPGVIGGLKMLKDFKLFIITNQSGIGRGYYSEEDMHKYNKRMLEEFDKHDIKIEKIYFCPHHPDEKCDCRKPNTKFLNEAANEFNIDLSKSWVIGDHPHDIKMGKAAGCGAVYLLTGHGVKHKVELGNIKPDLIAKEFLEAVRFVVENEEN